MAEATSFWSEAPKKARDIAVNVGEEIVGEKLKSQIEDKPRPVLKLLDSPEARQALDKAFDEASKEFIGQASTDDKRHLRQEVVDLLERTTRRGVLAVSRDVRQRYVLASDPNRVPLDRWVQRQLGGAKLVVGDRIYTQEEVTHALDAFFRGLNRAFWN